MVDWVYTDSSSYDLRNTMLKCTLINGVAVYSQMIDWGTCSVQQISPITNLPVCYTTEACKYAQTAYFIGMVWGQIFNFFVCKTRKLSVVTQGVANTFMFFALTTEIMLVLLITFFIPFNVAFGLRDNIFMHYGIPALPFGMLQLLIDEIRKYFIRTLPADK
jgi:sodium/potassium-transporting ATPase subunit alpha